jgi:DNA modification methylase
VLPTLEAESIDACVTDPPYGIGFMGREWDSFSPQIAQRKAGLRQCGQLPRAKQSNPNLKGRTVNGAISTSQIEYDFTVNGLREFQEWTSRWASEVRRALKPGAYLVVCGAPRSHHRMMCGLEDAGFVVRDCFAWLFGSGFPKNKNLGDGRGTALKPAHEPIALAWKPFKGSIAANVAKHGTGALNIDACRIEASDFEPKERLGATKLMADRPWNGRDREDGTRQTITEGHDLGRWPANVLLDEEAAALLDEQTGELTSGARRGPNPNAVTSMADAYDGGWSHAGGACDGSVGGASRFYYVAKPSREERDYGCYDLPSLSSFDTVSRDPSSAGANSPRAGSGRLSVLNTSEIVYTDPIWVNAVLARRLPADTDSSRPKVIGASTTECSDGSAWSMCWCGSPSTDPFHPVVKSIIETETSSITTSRISSSSRRPHTNGCMAAAFGVLASGGNLAAYAEFQSPWARLTGTSRKKAGPSTVDVNLATSIASWLVSAPEKPSVARRNGHPTVKPVELMRWLVKLVTPPGGTVLDPFTGSGTTGMACRYEQREFIGIEREAEYAAIAERRIAAVAPLFGEVLEGR